MEHGTFYIAARSVCIEREIQSYHINAQEVAKARHLPHILPSKSCIANTMRCSPSALIESMTPLPSGRTWCSAAAALLDQRQ